MSETNRPLYVELNEKRTSKEWKVGRNVGGNILMYAGDNEDYFDVVISRFSGTPTIGQSEVNARYAALSVNNLHHLAEANQGLISLVQRMAALLKVKPEEFEEYIKGQESLSRIS